MVIPFPCEHAVLTLSYTQEDDQARTHVRRNFKRRGASGKPHFSATERKGDETLPRLQRLINSPIDAEGALFVLYVHYPDCIISTSALSVPASGDVHRACTLLVGRESLVDCL